MREKFEHRSLTGQFRVACKFEDGSVRYWEDRKENVVQHIITITNEYASEGYVLTLRQLHYQLVTKNWIINHDTAYKKLGSILDDCRYAGVIDWNMIEDRGRKPYIQYSVKNIPQALEDTVDQYKLNRQEEQNIHVELWTEKDALSGILRRSTEKYHIQLVVNKGYTSSSALYCSYQRYIDCIREEKKVVILYFGDHDPSGLDMIRDIKDRLLLFLSQGHTIRDEFYEGRIKPWWEARGLRLTDLVENEYATPKILKLIEEENEDDDLLAEFDAGQVKMWLEEQEIFKVIPIGLTMEQVKKYKLPPNPTKFTDSRSDKYVGQFGKTCWEVDALRPQTLTAIVEQHIEDNIDMGQFISMVEQEARDIAKLKQLIKKMK